MFWHSYIALKVEKAVRQATHLIVAKFTGLSKKQGSRWQAAPQNLKPKFQNYAKINTRRQTPRIRSEKLNEVPSRKDKHHA